MRADFVDATVFMGMNSTDPAIRDACASFFVDRLDSTVAISLEQVGKCDDVVWGYSRQVQDAYYPFMDNVHTELRFDRLGYEERDIAEAHADTRAGMTITDKLQLAVVTNRGGTLHTLNPRLLAAPSAPVRRPARRPDGRVPFPAHLEVLYRDSLALLVDLEDM
ncbi:MAG: hypothetical protein HOY78_44455 [Saccharothrix sp.]|nr:hypothetical protein [Saccharothrix sp.]